MVAEPAARSVERSQIVHQTIAGPVRRADDAFEIIDRVRHDRMRIHHGGGSETSVDDRGGVIDLRHRGEIGAQALGQRCHRGGHARIVDESGCVDEHRKPRGAIAGRQCGEGLIQRGRERRLERVTDVLPAARTVAPEQKGQGIGRSRGAVGQHAKHVGGEAIEIGGQSGNYNEWMLVIRYAALLALVVWLGGMIVLGLIVAPATFQVLEAANPAAGHELAGSLFGTILWHFHLLAYGCAAVMLTCLFAIKFLGPPPASFIPRVSIVAVMLIVALYSGYPIARGIVQLRAQIPGASAALPERDAWRVQFNRLHETSTALMAVNFSLGLILLFWYVRE
jgi:hypothetical protein